ncbi:MAG: extracellular solute-binding protein [Lachnospiraceae bacterium]|nr:extracellular solute-binding protein [Lachnospiraceae bacterium]
MKKKLISLLVTTAMAATLLAGCGNTEKPAEDSAPAETEASTEDEAPAEDAAPAETEDSADEAAPADGAANYDGVTLTMWSMWANTEPQGKVLQEAADAFSAQTGATVNIEWKGRDIKTIIVTALEANENVDIFEEDYQRIASTYSQYCLDVTDMAEAAGYGDIGFQCFVDQQKEWVGAFNSIAEQPQVGGIFYNKDIFDAAGITTLPTTWDEFLAACQTMVDAGYEPMALDDAYADFSLGYHLSRHVGQDVLGELSVNGGWSENEKIIKGAQELIDFVNAGYLESGAPGAFPESQNKIGLTEKVAMIVCANYVCAEVNNNTGSNINWGLMNYPAVDGGADSSNAYAGANSLAISKNCANPQAAFDFIMFLTSGEFDQKMADGASQIPADSRNTAPAIMNGTVETLLATQAPLKWNMGLSDNSDLGPQFKDVAIKLFEGGFKTGEEFAAAMDALY